MLPRRLRRPLAIAVTGAVALVPTLTSCADEDGASATDQPDGGSSNATTTPPSTTTTTVAIAARRPFAPQHIDRVYERPGPDGAMRALATEVWVPDGDGPFPLIAFAHGNDGHPRKFHQLFEAWAAAGFAVVAPRFPVSADDANRDLAASVADGPEQNLDLEFVTEQVRAESARPDGELSGRIDPTDLAVAGLSLGGGTALQASYSDSCPALRPRIVIAFSPVPYETTQAATAPPLLLMHGTADRSLPYQGSVDYFASVPNRRWFVTMPDAGHADPYEDTPSAQDELVRKVSIDFLDAFLLDDADGIERGLADVAASGLATVETAG